MTKFYQFVGEVDSYKFKMQKKDACFVSKLHVQKNIYIHVLGCLAKMPNVEVLRFQVTKQP